VWWYSVVLLLIHLHVMHKQGMVSSGWDNPDFDSVLWVPVQELVIHEDLKITTFYNTIDCLPYLDKIISNSDINYNIYAMSGNSDINFLHA